MAVGKVLVIVGVGPNLGMAVAQRFGREGYRLALIARNADRLAGYAATLQGEGIEARTFVADVCDRAALEAALDAARASYGQIDAVEFSPMIATDDLRSALKVTPESIMPMNEHVLYGAVAVVNRVLPDMIARGDGVLIFTDGASAVTALPSHTNVGIAMAGLHRYVESLNISLEGTGVYAGEFVISGLRTPAGYADAIWDMAQSRDRACVVVGQWATLSAYEKLVARGVGQVHPPKMLKALPAARDAREREIFLLALYHVKLNGGWAEDSEVAEQNRREVQILGGDYEADFFGIPQKVSASE